MTTPTDPPRLCRITVFVDDSEEGPSREYELMEAWLARWQGQGKITIADYSCGGWEHIWDIECPLEVAAELPSSILCVSKWANWPERL